MYDVIGEHQDVDSMLLQLIDTRAQREELEGDVITVLVFWREYRSEQVKGHRFRTKVGQFGLT